MMMLRKHTLISLISSLSLGTPLLFGEEIETKLMKFCQEAQKKLEIVSAELQRLTHESLVENDQASALSNQQIQEKLPLQQVSVQTGKTADNIPREVSKKGHAKRWLAEGEFLYWRVDKGGLFYAIKKNFPVWESSDPSTPDGFAGHMYLPGLNWEPGFRIGFGYRFDRDSWLLKGIYTDYQARASNSTRLSDSDENNSNADLDGTFPQFTTTKLKSASSKIKISYQIEDLRLSKNFDLSRFINLDLFFGPEAAQIKQDWDVVYTGFLNKKSVHEMDWHYIGYGVNLGADTTWQVGVGIGMFLQASASALYGPFSTRVYSAANTNHPDSPSTFDIIQKSSPHTNRTVYTTQIKAGLSWERKFDRVNLLLLAAYEWNTWHNLIGDMLPITAPQQNQKPPIFYNSPFNLQGFTLKAALGF